MKLSRVITLGVSLFLASCSSAGWGGGYGPKGEGFVGSAFGYEDTRLSATQWYVSYTDVGVPRTMQKVHRRAKELCKKSGFPEYDFSANSTSTDSFGGLTTVGGQANCSRSAQTSQSPN